MAFQDKTTAKRNATSNTKNDLEAGTGAIDASPGGKPSNEQVLNVAFYSFVGFLLVQAIFALIANSESMLADSEAMSVDAITYLFNLCSERLKNRPPSEDELLLTPVELGYQRQLRRLYLEMIPPSISVFALMCITIYTLREACSTLFGWDGEEDDDDVSIPIMLFFSGFNLLLDVLNTYFFTKAGMNFGFTVVKTEHRIIRSSMSGMDDHSIMTEDGSITQDNRETARLLPSTVSHQIPYGSSDIAHREEESDGALVNLNMCSAWTVSSTPPSSLFVHLVAHEKVSCPFCHAFGDSPACMR